MSLTKHDLRQIRDLVREEVRGHIREEQDRFYERLKNNALSDINQRLDGMDAKIDSMAEDVARIPAIEGEIRLINQNITALREHAGI